MSHCDRKQSDGLRHAGENIEVCVVDTEALTIRYPLRELSKLHLNEDERDGKGGEWGTHHKRAGKNRAMGLTADCTADVGWWSWCVQQGSSPL